ncbi:MAG: hypothetical protein WCS57_06575, partial [Bacillota bacterium]
LGQDHLEEVENLRIALDGNDIIQILNIRPSPVVGEALDYLEEIVLRDVRLNDKETLSEILSEWWSKRR